MGLSSNSIIHFTSNKKALKGILKNNFKITCCSETIILNEKVTDFLVPMVSFCDIPLSQIKRHIKNYGSYGIGLTKEWAIKQKLNPVLYCEKNSSLANSYYHSLEQYMEGVTLYEMDESQKSLLDILRYMKNYQADLVRKDKKTKKDYRFSDEREWRYVPHRNADTPIISHLDKDTKENYNKLLSKYTLDFEPKDIKYIIIKKESEISEFINILKKANGKKYTHQDVERLATRIITTKQIKNDF